jgi:hypothetical protein
MKNPLKSLVAATASLLLVAASSFANDATAWTQLGFTIELSSGTLNVTPAGTFNDASAAWFNPAEPFSGSAAASALDGYAFAGAGASTAISMSLDAGNYFLVDAFAQTGAISGAGGSAAALALALYDLSFANVVGSTVTLTLTPVFYASELSNAGGSFGYVSAFLSLGAETYLSFQDSGSNAGLVDFAPITLTVGADETVALNLTASAGVTVPDTASTLSLGLLGFGLMLGLARHPAIAQLRR